MKGKSKGLTSPLTDGLGRRRAQVGPLGSSGRVALAPGGALGVSFDELAKARRAIGSDRPIAVA